MSDLFADLPDTDAVALERLHDRLADRADRAGLLDVAYRTLDSPLGPLLVAATETGVVRIGFDSEGHDHVLADLAAAVGPRIMRRPQRLDGVARDLDDYFAGRRDGLDEVAVDFQLTSGFRRDVLVALRAIPHGATATYGAVAVATGRPRAVRAVGTACARNPVPLVVPCHRVVRSDGSIGQYRGGVAAKQMLLTLESPS